MWWQVSEACASFLIRVEPLTQLSLPEDRGLCERIFVCYPDRIIEPFVAKQNTWNICEPDIVQLQTHGLVRPEYHWRRYFPLSAIPRIVLSVKLSGDYRCSDSNILRPSLTAICHFKTDTDTVRFFRRISNSSHFYPNIGSQLSGRCLIGELNGILCGFGGIFGCIGGSPSYFNAPLSRDKQPQSGQHQEHRENGEPFGVLGYSFIGSRFARAWRNATLERVFVAALLFAIG